MDKNQRDMPGCVSPQKVIEIFGKVPFKHRHSETHVMKQGLQSCFLTAADFSSALVLLVVFMNPSIRHQVDIRTRDLVYTNNHKNLCIELGL